MPPKESGEVSRKEGTGGSAGANAKDREKDKEQINGRKKDNERDEATTTEELSEEDLKMKEELEMLVERLSEPRSEIYLTTLDAIKTTIKTSTSSMTAVPKPLKFLRPYYETLEKIYEKWPDGEARSSLADMLSVLGMTYSNEERRDTLRYRLLCPSKDLGSWGHEYMRHLALEIGEEYQARVNDEINVDDITDLGLALVPFFLDHNAEADAVDLLSELEIIEQITQFLDEKNYSRVCLYMVSLVALLPYPDNNRFLRTSYGIYLTYEQYTQAMTLAIRLNDRELIVRAYYATNDRSVRRQMAFLMARQRIAIDLPDDELNEFDLEIVESMNNHKLSEHFSELAKELSLLEPKTPEDIYKTHLDSSRTAGLANTDSMKNNLASAFVNAFVNAGFGEDKLMLVGDSKTSWIWKTKDDGMISAAASTGLLMLWDIEAGLDRIDPYTYAQENWIKAGAALATGIINSGVRMESDPALALLQEGASLSQENKHIRIASIFGLGLAYAGSNNEEVLTILKEHIHDDNCDMQTAAMSALTLGLVFVGSANSEISETFIEFFLDEDRQSQMKDKWTRFMALGLALLYFGQQEGADVILETLKAIDHDLAKFSFILTEICAWAGTGNVLKLQQLLHICTEPVEKGGKGIGTGSGEHDGEDDDTTTTGMGTSASTTAAAANMSAAKKKLTDEVVQSYAVIGMALVTMGEEIGQEMILRQFGHLMHWGQSNIRKAVPLALGLISASHAQMKVYETLSRYSHDNDGEVAINAIFAMGLLGAGTNNARISQLLRQLANYYVRDGNALFMVRIAQGLVHMGKGTMSINPFHTDRQVLSRVAAAGLLVILVSMIEAREFILGEAHYLLYAIVTAMYPRFLITLDEDLRPLRVSVRVGQAVDVVGQAGRPKTITGWQTQSTPVLLSYGERAELEDQEYVSLSSTLEGIVILRKNPEWEG